MILRILAGSALALGLGLFAEGVQAAQTFVCEDGRLLQVELRDLERLKRDEPCVAAHYGLDIQTVPLPVKRPKQTAVKTVPELKGPQVAAKSRSGVGLLAQSATNYRNVRIINAQPGARAWFLHTR